MCCVSGPSKKSRRRKKNAFWTSALEQKYIFFNECVCMSCVYSFIVWLSCRSVFISLLQFKFIFIQFIFLCRVWKCLRFYVFCVMNLDIFQGHHSFLSSLAPCHITCLSVYRSYGCKSHLFICSLYLFMGVRMRMRMRILPNERTFVSYQVSKNNSKYVFHSVLLFYSILFYSIRFILFYILCEYEFIGHSIPNEQMQQMILLRTFFHIFHFFCFSFFRKTIKTKSWKYFKWNRWPK